MLTPQAPICNRHDPNDALGVMLNKVELELQKICGEKNKSICGLICVELLCSQLRDMPIDTFQCVASVAKKRLSYTIKDRATLELGPEIVEEFLRSEK